MAAEERQVVRFEYQQSLAYAEGQSWSEALDVSVRILSEALSTGWYRATFGKDSKSFLVLIAIVMHARPLRGDDLALLVRLGMATLADEGRLYARVTDIGLAAELGFHRSTVADCAAKLAKLRALRPVRIPEHLAFRDSHGQFAGAKVYLISGELENIFQKEVAPRSGRDYRAGKSSTDRAGFSGSCAEKVSINIDSDSDDVVGNVRHANGKNLPAALAYFAYATHKVHYQPGEKEHQALNELIADGYHLDTEIIPGINRAVEHAKEPVQKFTYCAKVIRQARAEVAARQAQTWLTVAGEQKHAAQTNAPAGAEQQAPPPSLPPIAVPPELTDAVDLITQAYGPPARPALVRLIAMMAQVDSAARSEGATGGAWVLDALIEALGQASEQHILAYAHKILRSWLRNGRFNALPAARAQGAPQTAAQAAGETEAAQGETGAGQAARGRSATKVITPEILVFQEATGRLPLRDQFNLVMRIIRTHHLTASDLRPFWEEWVALDRKRTDLTWLHWAEKGEISQSTSAHAKASNVQDVLRSLSRQAQKGQPTYGNP